MRVNFTKMQGLGNDFMLVEWPDTAPDIEAGDVRRLADRKLGVGFDQLLSVRRASSGETAARYRVFNAQGGEVEQCGNGVRCIASWLAPPPGTAIRLESAGGVVEARVLADGRVRVNLGVPDFRPASLPFEAPGEALEYAIELDSGAVRFGAVSMGNPHIVLPVDSARAAPVGILGPELAVHSRFPRGVNVGFMQILSAGRIGLRVHERGVGETLACGTGAAAAVAVGRLWGKLAETVEVDLPGGRLEVEWSGPGEPLWQTGPAAKVYEGRIDI